jgi:hypothetical protein
VFGGLQILPFCAVVETADSPFYKSAHRYLTADFVEILLERTLLF